MIFIMHRYILLLLLLFLLFLLFFPLLVETVLLLIPGGGGEGQVVLIPESPPLLASSQHCMKLPHLFPHLPYLSNAIIAPGVTLPTITRVTIPKGCHLLYKQKVKENNEKNEGDHPHCFCR